MRQKKCWSSIIAAVPVIGIGLHLTLRMGRGTLIVASEVPLYMVLFGGGVPLVSSLALKLARGQFGSDLLAGISIVAATLLGGYFAGALVVFVLLGGGTLGGFSLRPPSPLLP